MLDFEDPMLRSGNDGTRAEKALDLLMKGYMCSEAIVMAFADTVGLAPEMAARISGGFAGGMAQAKTCGAVSGAIMLVGLKYGAGLKRDQYARDHCFLLTQEFSHRFIRRRKSLECADILKMHGVDPGDREAMKHLREMQLCDKIVRDSAEVLEALFSEEPS